MKSSTYNDVVNVIENGEGDETEQALAMQHQINSGSIWKFQGSMGRAAMNALRSGVCILGRDRAIDAYGNAVPSRDDVKAGTTGSYELTRQFHGEEYADMLAAVE